MALRRYGLAQRRKAVGFTQESLAERLGVERSTVVRWETGETEPLPYIRPKIARALQVSIDQLAQLLNSAQQGNASDDHVRDVDEPVTPSRSFVPPNRRPAPGSGGIDPDADMVAMQSFRAADKRVGGAYLYASVVTYLHAQLAHHRHRPHRAVQLARQGINALNGGPQTSLHAQLFTMQAKDAAALGHSQECTKLLLDAEKALAAPADAHELSLWVSTFDEGSFAHEAARCMRTLGHFGQAQHQAQHVLELRARDRTRSRAFGQLILATILIAQGEPDQACALAKEVLDATQSLGSYVVLQQLIELKELLKPHHKNSTVTGFLTCFGQVLRERQCLYPRQPEDERKRSTDGVEDM